MDAKQCDICGGFYKGIKAPTDVVFPQLKKQLKVLDAINFQVVTPGGGMFEQRIDVCPKCMSKIADLVKELGDNDNN